MEQEAELMLLKRCLGQAPQPPKCDWVKLGLSLFRP